MSGVRKVNSILGLDHIVLRVLGTAVLTQEVKEHAMRFVLSHHIGNSEFLNGDNVCN